MAVAYQGEAKTDAWDAYVIAETVRHRGDLHEVQVPTALVSELRLLVAHRSDLVAERAGLHDLVGAHLRVAGSAGSNPARER